MQAIRRKLYKLRSKKPKPTDKSKDTVRTSDIEAQLRKSGMDEDTIRKLRGKDYKGT